MPAKATAPAKISVDFSDVEDRRAGGGKAAHVPEGDYLLQVVGCERRKKKDSDPAQYYLSWQCAIAKPEKFKNKGVIYHNTSLKPEALWSLRNFLEDLGFKVEKKAISLPIASIVEKKPLIGATLEDGDEYNGKIKSQIAATFKKSEYQESESDDDEDEDEDTETSSDSDTEDDDEDLEELDTEDL